MYEDVLVMLVFSVGYVSCNQTNQCIPTSWLCDGDDDCKQGQDETPELCGETFLLLHISISILF